MLTEVAAPRELNQRLIGSHPSPVPVNAAPVPALSPASVTSETHFNVDLCHSFFEFWCLWNPFYLILRLIIWIYYFY